MAALEKYFKPKINVVYERFLFNSAMQNPEERIDAFVNTLRKMALSCKYGALTDWMFKDRILIGIQDKIHNFKYSKKIVWF